MKLSDFINRKVKISGKVVDKKIDYVFNPPTNFQDNEKPVYPYPEINFIDIGNGKIIVAYSKDKIDDEEIIIFGELRKTVNGYGGYSDFNIIVHKWDNIVCEYNYLIGSLSEGCVNKKVRVEGFLSNSPKYHIFAPPSNFTLDGNPVYPYPEISFINLQDDGQIVLYSKKEISSDKKIAVYGTLKHILTEIPNGEYNNFYLIVDMWEELE